MIFKCQLAKLLEIDKLDLLFENGSSFLVEKKIDGIRCLLYNNKNGCLFLTRTGKEIVNLSFLIEKIGSLPSQEFIIDGELYCGDWSKTIQFSSTLQENFSDEMKDVLKNISFNCFDYIPAKDFIEGKCNIPLIERKILLSNFLKNAPKEFVEVKYTEATCSRQVLNEYDKALFQGDEGVMLKGVNSPYKCTRNKYWLKLKPEQTEEAEIIGIIEGNGKISGMLGAFEVKSREKIFFVGTGLTQKQRIMFWNQKENMIGKIIEYKKAKECGNNNFRFPVFLRIREDLDN